MKTSLTILSALVLLTYADPCAALGPLDVEAEIGLYSKYVWRGMIEADEAVLQPVLSADLLGFGAEIWTNLDFAVALGYGTPDYVTGYFPFSATPDKAVSAVDAGPTDFLATVSLPYRPLDIVTISPSLSYATLLGDAQDVVEAAGGDKDAVIVGITAGLGF